ncbi:hypothetical protein [Kitasatospora sp. NPDC059571]|uniref:hypothetical protein n=1 Tax=Kitasatospora sp. NPDC059571 TaxID=3346871 RepID=UPI00367CE601
MDARLGVGPQLPPGTGEADPVRPGDGDGDGAQLGLGGTANVQLGDGADPQPPERPVVVPMPPVVVEW